MKKTCFLFLAILISLSVQAQNIEGDWNGLLTVQGIQLRLVFHISATQNGYQATMDSPDQGAKGIPVNSTTFENPVLKIQITAIGMNYEGTLTNDSVFTGTFKQAGLTLPLKLTRAIPQKKALNRPQEPHKPYPYNAKEVTFRNSHDNTSLAGTLTFPREGGPFPAVILISGSGPQNRDEEVFGHKPFLVLAHHLTQQGIAVLRYDDRGTASSTGQFITATESDFVSDVESAIDFLKTRPEIDQKQVGLIGHSEGGIIAPQVAAKNTGIAFIILLAGVGIPGDQLLLMQQNMLGKASGIAAKDLQKAETINRGIFNLILKHKDTDTLKKHLSAYLKHSLGEMPHSLKPAGISEEIFRQRIMEQMSIPWMLDIVRYKPAPVLKQVRCPVLALNGEKDLQVPAQANLKAIEQALIEGGNSRVTTKELPGLNHLFQNSSSGLPAEYGTIEETFAPEALNEISNWILTQQKK